MPVNEYYRNTLTPTFPVIIPLPLRLTTTFNMFIKELLQSKLGRLRIIGFLEGLSLLILLFIAVPLKHLFGIPMGSMIVGLIHGALFLDYIYLDVILRIERVWKFFKTTWKVLLSSFIPFGTFYLDKVILSKMDDPN